MKTRIGICAFCGLVKTVTDDHVPPKCIFSKGLRVNLPTAPGCTDCNRGSSQDDEYLFSVILRLNGISNDFKAQEAIGRLRRCLAKPNKVGFAAGFYSSVRVFDSMIPPNVAVGYQTASKIDLDRLAMSIRKIVKGLYYSRTNSVLAADKRIVVISNWEYTRQLTESMREGLNSMLVASDQIPPVVSGQGAFVYKWIGAFRPECQYDSVLMSFYGKVEYFGLITDQPAADRWEQILHSKLLMPPQDYVFA